MRALELFAKHFELLTHGNIVDGQGNPIANFSTAVTNELTQASDVCDSLAVSAGMIRLNRKTALRSGCPIGKHFGATIIGLSRSSSAGSRQASHWLMLQERRPARRRPVVPTCRSQSVQTALVPKEQVSFSLQFLESAV
jgi:hypothetical protein